MAYAQVSDVQSRLTRVLSEDEINVCSSLLDDAATIIDSKAEDADDDIKKLVSIRMVVRAIGDGDSTGMPIGASQGSVAALGYSQSWTMGTGSIGELYLSRSEKEMLGIGGIIGSYSPVEELAEGEV